jgi:NADH:ubiquinone oxidoreductase subunit E
MANGGKLRRRLKASLKQRSQKKGRARLVLTNCFGICPKGAVVTASAATFARGEFLLIRDCSEESIERATTALC